MCVNLKSIPAGPIAGGEIGGYSEIGVKQLDHLTQVAMTGQFQQFQTSFRWDRTFGIKGKLVDVRRIDEPPIKFLYIDGDKTCPVDLQRPLAETIPSTKSHHTIYGRSHDLVVGDNDDEFLNLLMENLSDHSDVLSVYDCEKLMNGS